MLDAIRTASSKWLGRLVLTVIMGFLIISFAIWGIGDIFRDQGGTSSGQSVSDARKDAAEHPNNPQAWRDLSTALQTEVVLVVSTRDEAHCEELLGTLRSSGYVVERLGPPTST